MFPPRPPYVPTAPFPPRYDCDGMIYGKKQDGEVNLFNHWTKAEADARFAGIETEASVAGLTDRMTAAEGEILQRATVQDVQDLTEEVNAKADASDLTALAADVETKASEQEAIDIRARLDVLEYQQIAINSFTASPPLAEMGSSVDVALTWSLNKAPTIQTIGGVPVTGTPYTVQNVTKNTTWELNVTDGKTSANRTVSITFQNGVYYGVAPDLASVTTLTKVLSGAKSRTITVNAGTNEYIIYAIPARLGNVEFYVSGFEGGFDAPVEQSLTNASGYTEPYKVYKSTNANLGETTVEVR